MVFNGNQWYTIGSFLFGNQWYNIGFFLSITDIALFCVTNIGRRGGSAGEVCPRQRVSVGITELFAVGSRHSVRREEL